jgi:carbamoyl-phosphate synthase large subunit
MDRKTVLVTGTGGRSVGSGIVHALKRTTKEVGSRWRVIAADADPFAWGLYKADHGVVVPMAKDPKYIPEILRLVKLHNIDAIIPGTEVEIDILLENNDVLSPAVVIANRKALLPLMLDKFATAEKLKQLGYNVIPTVPLEEWQQLLEEHDFPFIVKPTQSTGGSKGLHLVSCKEDLLRLLPTFDRNTSPCIQPYIGSSESEYTVGVISDFNGKVIDSIVMRRKLIGLSLLNSFKLGLRKYEVSTGYSQGFIIKDDGIQSFCESLALDLGSVGPLNIQLRIDEKTGEPYVFEIHPRFSGTTPIRADVGLNEVDILLRNKLFSESFDRQNYRYDVAAIRAFEHVIVPIEDLV